MVNDVISLEKNILLNKYKFKETKDWKLNEKRHFFTPCLEEDIRKVLYRPFDHKYTFYPLDRIHQIIVRGDDKKSLMKHFLIGENIGIVMPKQSLEGLGVLATKTLCENKLVSAYNPNFLFPLYLYPETSGQQTTDHEQLTRTPNLDPDILSKIAKNLDLSFVPEKEIGGNVCMANSEEVRDDFKTSFAPIDLLDYIYAVLHSPEYREKYKEFLKIDFPRVPYPKDSEKFWKLVELGRQIRQLHLLESPLLEKRITGYPEDGDNIITRKITKTSPGYEPDSETHGKVWINDQQYFDNVPLIAWEFYIGGYQPAQKWLKDRKGRELSFEDILHYQKMIMALTETDRLMKEIDKVRVVVKESEVEISD